MLISKLLQHVLFVPIVEQPGIVVSESSVEHSLQCLIFEFLIGCCEESMYLQRCADICVCGLDDAAMFWMHVLNRQGFPTAVALGFTMMLSKKRRHLVAVLVWAMLLMS